MISICITVYNFPVQELINNIVLQAKLLNVDFEILIGDDSSQKTELILGENISYFFNTPALKRSKNRNFLASQAKYDYLLFIDGDAKVDNKQFLFNYIKEIKNKTLVTCGGTAYSDYCYNKNKLLHWRYGKFVESRTAKQRQENPYNSFSSFNFLIKKDVFLRIKFNENLTEYGHEDTIFGLELERNNIPIKHIDNQLVHKGIEFNDVFVQKSLKAVENLVYISENIDNSISEKVRLCVFYRKIKSNIVLFFLLQFTGKLFYNCVKYRTVSFANIKMFSLLKLLYLNKILTKNKNRLKSKYS